MTRSVRLLAAAAAVLVAACGGDDPNAGRGADATERLAQAVDARDRSDLYVTYRSGSYEGEQAIALRGLMRSGIGPGYFWLERPAGGIVACDDRTCTLGDFNSQTRPSNSIIEIVDLLQLPEPCRTVGTDTDTCDFRFDDPRTIAGREAFCVEGRPDRTVDGDQQTRCYDRDTGILLFADTGVLTVEAVSTRPTVDADFEPPFEPQRPD